MAKTRFESFPECCQVVLEELERQGRSGARNCAKGHLVSIEYALMLEAEAEARAKAAAEQADKTS